MLELRRSTALLALTAAVGVLVAAPVRAAPPPALTLTLGATFIASGQTGSEPGKHQRALGTVFVRGRYGTGAWLLLKTTRTDATGHYRFTLRPSMRGVLTLRITPPDRRSRRYVLRVV